MRRLVNILLGLLHDLLLVRLDDDGWRVRLGHKAQDDDEERHDHLDEAVPLFLFSGANRSSPVYGDL